VQDDYAYGWVSSEQSFAEVNGTLASSNRLRLYLMSVHAVSPKLFSMFDYMVRSRPLSPGWASIAWLIGLGCQHFQAKPFSNAELFAASVAEFGSLIIFGWLTSSLNSYLSTGKLASQEYRHRMDLLKEFLRIKKVPFTTRRKIRMFYQHYFKKKTVFNETEILRNLPPNVASELIYTMYKGIIEVCT
jgi:hypothetical protein